MDTPELNCRDDRPRRMAVRRSPTLTGLDYLEVSQDRRTLTVYFLDQAPADLSPANIRIDGGRRVRELRVVDLRFCRQEDPDLDDCVQIRLDRPGDASTYRLCVVAIEAGRPTRRPHPAFDPRYACLDFTFTAGCPSDLDCLPEAGCPPEARPEPELNYLAKDYGSFRQLILDRLALIMPGWQERHVPDIGVALVEVLAYTGDYLSYYQDAVATEAYLDTARLRVSVRRHARLVDYAMHEGSNARAWVCLKLNDAPQLELDPRDFYVITRYRDEPGPDRPLAAAELDDLPAGAYEVFEPLVDDPAQPIRLLQVHNEIHFYTWGERECCLPRGATRATLVAAELPVPPPDPSQPPEPSPLPTRPPPSKSPPAAPARPRLALAPGDFLILKEVLNPATGNAADADPAHRHVVRLTRVTPNIDPLLGDVPVLDVEWAEADALPFPLCLSATSAAPDCQYLPNVSVACGNVILVDHGWRVDDELLDPVPTDRVEAHCPDDCCPAEVSYRPGRYAPRLAQAPLTFSQPLRPGAPAAWLSTQDPRQAQPWLRLVSTPAEVSPLSVELGVDLPGLAARLREARDPLAAYLKSQLAPDTRERLDAYPGTGPLDPVLNDALLSELNAQLDNRALYDPSRLAGVPLRRETERLLAHGSRQPRLGRLLNRWLLEDAFPAFIPQTRRHWRRWTPQPDLLGSRPEDDHVVVEMDNDGSAHLRFGDGELGRQPEAETRFWATYRVGNGPAGNVGAGTLSHLVSRTVSFGGLGLQLTNPLAARGGTPPEPLAEVRLFAPDAARAELQRAITTEDYARLVERAFGDRVQRAAASRRTTGHCDEIRVAVDARGGLEPAPALLAEIGAYLERYRRIGHDVVVMPAAHVPLAVTLEVCVRRGYLRGHVKAALLDVFSSRLRRDGTRGLFHPDNLSFGEGIYLSRLVALAQAVTGVESVRVTQLERLGEGPAGELESGQLPLGPLEIARLDNDPSFPDNGRLRLTMLGGR
jgi:hypothetical protein